MKGTERKSLILTCASDEADFLLMDNLKNECKMNLLVVDQIKNQLSITINIDRLNYYQSIKFLKLNSIKSFVAF